MTLLKQQDEPAAWPRPRDVDASQAMLRTTDARNPGLDQAVMLKEVEMPPSELREIMRLTERRALGTWVAFAPRGFDLNANFARRLAHVQRLSYHTPRFRQPKPKGQQIVCIHSWLPPSGGGRLT